MNSGQDSEHKIILAMEVRHVNQPDWWPLQEGNTYVLDFFSLNLCVYKTDSALHMHLLGLQYCCSFTQTCPLDLFTVLIRLWSAYSIAVVKQVQFITLLAMFLHTCSAYMIAVVSICKLACSVYKIDSALNACSAYRIVACNIYQQQCQTCTCTTDSGQDYRYQRPLVISEANTFLQSKKSQAIQLLRTTVYNVIQNYSMHRFGLILSRLIFPNTLIVYTTAIYFVIDKQCLSCKCSCADS